MHIKDGLAAVKLQTGAGKVVEDYPDPNCLVRSPFFQVEKLTLSSVLEAEVTPASPHIVVAVEGSGIIESEHMEPVSFARGEAVVVPASVREYRVCPQWQLDIMRMSLPEANAAVPKTVLTASAERQTART